MKGICIAILLFGVIFLVAACGGTERTDRGEATEPAGQPDTEKEVYWEKTEDLGLEEKSTIRLECRADRQEQN